LYIRFSILLYDYLPAQITRADSIPSLAVSHSINSLATMSDGTLFKPDKDFSKDADKILPEAESLAKVMVKQNASEPQADFWIGRPAEGYRQNSRA
jgi:hypothetical protein